MAKFVDVFSKATGRPHRVPEHFVDHPVLGRDITTTPPADATPTGEPSEEWTVAQLKDHATRHGVSLGGATTKADILAALNQA